MATQAANGSDPCRILVVDLEPTPYKTDLWNAFAASGQADLSVIYTERKNWAPDGGHNYQKWPENTHRNTVLEGRGWAGRAKSALAVASGILRGGSDLVCIAGYAHLATIVAIVVAIVLRKRFVVHADEFNNQRPQGRLPLLKLAVRETLRWMVFSQGDAVLVCGRRGVESALQAGCPRGKILDFPYVIDVERMKRDEPGAPPPTCLEDLGHRRCIVFFSGRMIPRKGLQTLLSAMTRLRTRRDWVLWVEGDGPESERYRRLADQLGVAQRCRFLGFCQYDTHSWLIRSSDIVVVPSLEDTWGIVVDEGLQLGKAVISSHATGSGYDRIEDGRNGCLFPAEDADALAALLDELIDDEGRRAVLGAAAVKSPKNLAPSDNLETLLRCIRAKA